MEQLSPRPPEELSALGTFCDAYQRNVSEHGDEIALRTVGDGVSMAWSEAGVRVGEIAGALAGLGVGRGDTVAMMLTNRPEFHLIDAAALHLGATPFSIYNTSTPEQIAHVVGNAGARVLITEQQFLPVVTAAGAEVPGLESIVSLDGGDARSLEDAVASAPADFDLEAAWRAVEPDDVAVLIYTSGTTGPPKGVQLTHRNLLLSVTTIVEAIPAMGERGRLISYLPHAHLADRFFSQYLPIVTGSSVTCVADPKQVVAALPEVRPTIWGAVPRIWEKMQTALEARLLGHEDERVRELAPKALEIGVARARGEDLAPEQLALYERAEEMLFGPLRQKLGLDSVEAAFSGAAPISAEVLEFFAALGLEILECYGMSECSAIVVVNLPGEARIGTVGEPLPGVELQLAEDGEILIRCGMVMAGYRGQPEKTAEAIDGDGWLHTGDVGEIDPDGYLKVVDRKKELIINAAGKNMSPANIENTIKSCSPLIGSAVAIGDRRSFNTALLVLDPDAAAAYAQQHGLDDPSPAAVAKDERVRAAIGKAIDQANERLSRVEQVKRWTLLAEEWQPGGDELTPTMKLKRKPIAEKYADEIEAMYA